MMTKNSVKMVSGTVVVALSMLLVAGPALAAFSEKDAGTRGAQFLKLPVGAKAIGMGGAYTAVADDVNAMYYNPAGLARLESKNAEYMYSSYMLKDKVDGETNPGQHWIAFGMPISPEIGAAGIGIQYYSAGDINKTDLRANKSGTFSPSDMAVNLSYARQLMAPEHTVGMNLKIINSKIEESATAIAVDFGAQSRKFMEGKLLLGLAIQNLGSSLKYETESTKLPILIRLGSGYKVQENWTAGLDIVYPEDNGPELALGTDYKYKMNDEMALSGRLGYTSKTRKVDGFSGLTIGAGFGFKMASLDMAYEPLGDMGSTLKISLGMKF